MPDLTFAVPGGLDLPTGGATYDREVVAALRAAGWRVEVLTWPGSFPFPTRGDRERVASDLAALADGMLVLVDGLALGTLPELMRAHSARLRLVALVHHPLALETGLRAEVAARFAAEEREALRWIRAVIVTSETTAETLRTHYEVPADRITVALPGIEPRVARLRAEPPRTPRILSVGQVSPRKAYHVLVDALALVSDLAFSATIAGDAERDPTTVSALRAQIDAAGLAGRVSLAGAVEPHALEALYAQAELFAFPSIYEGYGMALAEAMACGLPIVATTGGAIPEVVPASAGLLVAPGDAIAFSAALRSLLSNAGLRTALGEGARIAGLRLGDWNATAAVIAARLALL